MTTLRPLTLVEQAIVNRLETDFELSAFDLFNATPYNVDNIVGALEALCNEGWLELRWEQDTRRHYYRLKF